MSDCEKYVEMMSEMVDGELTAEQEAELRAHIAVCPDCTAVYEAFRAISGAISEDLVPPPATLAEGIMYKINLHKKAGRRFAFGPFTAVAACLVLVFFGALHFGLLGGSKAGSTESAPVLEAADNNLSSSMQTEEAPEAAAGGQETEKTQAPADGEDENGRQYGDGNDSLYFIQNNATDAGVPEQGCDDATVLQFGFSSQSVMVDNSPKEEKKEPEFLFEAKEIRVYEGKYYHKEEDADKNKLLFTLTEEDELDSLREFVTAIPDDDVDYSPEDSGIMKSDPLYTLYVPADREKDKDEEDKVICIWFVDEKLWCVIIDADMDDTAVSTDSDLEDISEKIIYKAVGVQNKFEKYIEDIKEAKDIT